MALIDKVRDVLASLREEAESTPGSKQTRKEVASSEIPVGDITPNTWNPNVLGSEEQEKLRRGISLILSQGLRPPPITVRELEPGSYQIIDGYHRWLTFRDLGERTIPAYVLNCDEKTARILTTTLNYLRGEKDLDKYSNVLADLVNNHAASIEELSELLPETHEELLDILEISSSGIEAILKTSIANAESAKQLSQEISDDDLWMDVTFRVSKSQANIIEAEINRIERTLAGRNRRGRALEFMAVQSSQTPLQKPKAKPVRKREEEA